MDNNYQNPLASPPSNTPPTTDKPIADKPAVAQPTNEQPEQQSDQPEQIQARYVKAAPPKKSGFSAGRVLAATLGMLLFFGIGLAGVMISQRQYVSQEPVAPTAPQSQPEAAVSQAACTLTFNVPVEPEPAACGFSPCDTDDDCKDDLVCITADDGDNYCAIEEYEEACADDPNETTCCTEPTPTPEILECGESGCVDNFDCEAGLICIAAGNGNHYCGEPDYKSACGENPSETSCCTAPTNTPAPTPTLSITPTNEQPDLPEELPQSGPADWLKYLQAGLATLGVGALLLLLL